MSKRLPPGFFNVVTDRFRGYSLPDAAESLAGYSALIHVYQLQVPLPFRLYAVSDRNIRLSEGRWEVMPARYTPQSNWMAHVTFAMKYEGIDLLVLKNLFEALPAVEIRQVIEREPTGKYSRLVWFYYEWLSDTVLDLPDAMQGNYVDAVNTKLQFCGPSRNSSRHRVRNNLPGVAGFCPMIRKTKPLLAYMEEDLQKQIRDTVDRIHPDIMARAAAFLLLRDSKASFAIEGEKPAPGRAERWGRAVVQAGRQPLTSRELLRLQEILIAGSPMVQPGWRSEGGFVGVHDRLSGRPMPDHISARHEDLPVLLQNFIEALELMEAAEMDAVLMASVFAFGFVFIHPFEDGNGRLHRYIIHHILAGRNFAPPGIVFPISAVILNRLDEYRWVLEEVSRPRLDFIQWEPTDRGNVRVINDTADLYRYFDATSICEFLYSCVHETVTRLLPEEVDYLRKHDAMRGFLDEHFDLPEPVKETLIGFLRQQNGRLSNRARRKEFEPLSDAHVALIENGYRNIFGAD
ncbi:MAG: Fic family protein [Balneolaceae bacterium]|nr:MAG: Fic family protein [Balneolaceae bacterium]